MSGRILACGLVAVLFAPVSVGLFAQEAPARQRQLEITFDLQGHVTLVAENVTTREILAEWGRVGGSYMINVERLPSVPVEVMRFAGRPEREVLDSLLRGAAGYILGPRTARTAGPSLFETVMILPTSTPVASGAFPGPSPVASPLRTPGAPEDEIPPVVPAVGVQAPPNAPAPAQPRPPSTPGVFVPIVPVTTPVTPPATPTTTGRGRGGGGF